MSTTNVTDYSFNEWVKFVFDHPVTEPEWYMEEHWGWEGEPEVVLRYVIQLMSQVEVLVDMYSAAQIEQGLWFLVGPVGGLFDWLWDEDIDWNLRRECIQSMANIFKTLFVRG